MPAVADLMTPRALARLAGALFLATIAGGVVAQAVLADPLVVTGDAAATARNIVANPSVVRAAFSIFMIEMACQIAFTAVMYQLLAPVDRGLSRMAAAFGYVGSGIKILSRVFFYAPLFVLGGSPALSAFTHGQLEAMAYLSMRINDQGAGMACIFLGFNTVIVGYVMLRARFLPRMLGILALTGGFGWLAFIYPPLGGAVFTPVALFALLSSAITIGWLLIRGVDDRAWRQTLASSGESIWR